MIDFKKFYKEVYFDIDRHDPKIYSAKQGDTHTRGFSVQIIQNNKIIPVTDESLIFYARRLDRVNLMTTAVKDGTKFRVDIPNEVFKIPGKYYVNLVC